MKITEKEYAVYRQQAIYDIIDRAKIYGYDSAHKFCRIEQQCSFEEEIEWVITQRLYGINLSPSSGFTVVKEKKQ